MNHRVSVNVRVSENVRVPENVRMPENGIAAGLPGSGRRSRSLPSRNLILVSENPGMVNALVHTGGVGVEGGAARPE